MKRISTGLLLGITTLIFIFLSSNLIFKIGLYLILLFSAYELFKHKKINNALNWIIIIVILINVYLVDILSNNFSRSFFFTLILISVFTDVFALIFGKLLGRNYIFPNVSPNKTLEGSLFGLFTPAAIAIFLSFLFLEKGFYGSQVFIEYLYMDSLISEWGYFFSFFVITVCSFGSIFGDLIASKAKRQMKIKDFSNILPGHGGILDRIDSHLFCIPVFVSFNTFL